MSRDQQQHALAPNELTEAVNPGRRRFIRTAAGGIIVAAATPGLLAGCNSATRVPESAIAAWTRKEDFEDVRLWALSHAILAPNPHNQQPWLVDLARQDEIQIAIDPDRVLPETDPAGRQIMVGTGAMLGLLELAAAERGYNLETEWIGDLPANTDSMVELGTPILRVKFSRAGNSGPTNKNTNLFSRIRNRHTARGEYDPARVPNSGFTNTLPELKSASQSLGVVDRKANPADFEQVAAWVKQAWEIELTTPHTMMESIRLLRVGASEIEKHRDGIVIDDPFIVALERIGLMDRSKAPKPGSRILNGQINEFNTAVDSTPGWFWLASDDNSRMSQVECGSTFVKAQLKATELGMVMHPVSQGLQEYPEMDDTYLALQEHFSKLAQKSGQTLQMLTRIGYLAAGSDPATPSPRRGMEAHIV